MAPPGRPGAARIRDRGTRLTEVRDVVERIVKPEDLDSVLGRARDEPSDDVARDGSRADEKTAAQGDPQRCRDARLDRANALPRALDTTPDGRVEDAAARDLEACESSLVEDLGHTQDLPGRQRAGKGLLREQANRRIDQLWHAWTLAG